MAPEQVRGDPIGPAADIFALGALLYELVAGRQPFRHETVRRDAECHPQGEPPPLSSVPPAVDRVIARCLEKDPGESLPVGGGCGVRAGCTRTGRPAAAPPARERASGVRLAVIAAVACCSVRRCGWLDAERGERGHAVDAGVALGVADDAVSLERRRSRKSPRGVPPEISLPTCPTPPGTTTSGSRIRREPIPST